MKQKKFFIIGLILLAAISFIIFILVSGSGNKGVVTKVMLRHQKPLMTLMTLLIL